MPVDSPVVAAALEYAGYGWRVVQIPRGSKAPRGQAWQTHATNVEAEILRRWSSYPDDGVGVLLGPSSGIIDLECDSPEAEAALADLWAGDPPVTATFSASRGKHRIFRWRDDLPQASKAVWKWGALEVRTGAGGKGAQSVFPPSVHPSGVPYLWLAHPADVGIADIPDSVVYRLGGARMFAAAPPAAAVVGGPSVDDRNGLALAGSNGSGRAPAASVGGNGAHRDWEALVERGVGEGDRNSAAAAFAGRLLADLRDPWDDDQANRAWLLLRLWNGRNSPPLGDGELRATFLSILRRERTSFAVGRSGVDHGIIETDELAASGLVDPAVPRYPSAELVASALGVVPRGPSAGDARANSLAEVPAMSGEASGASPSGENSQIANSAGENPPNVDGLAVDAGAPVATVATVCDSGPVAAAPAAAAAPRRRTKAERADRALQAVAAGWKIDIVLSKPVLFRVYSPLWAGKTDEGWVEVSASALCSAASMRVAVAGQAKVLLPKFFPKLWDGDAENDGIGAYLLSIAESIRPPLEHHRDLVVAEQILAWIGRRKVLDDGVVPNSQSRCCLLADGNTVFRHAVLFADLNRASTVDRITRAEISDILRRAGFAVSVIRRGWGSGEQRRWCVGNEQNVDRLRAAIEANDPLLLDQDGAVPEEMFE